MHAHTGATQTIVVKNGGLRGWCHGHRPTAVQKCSRCVASVLRRMLAFLLTTRAYCAVGARARRGRSRVYCVCFVAPGLFLSEAAATSAWPEFSQKEHCRQRQCSRRRGALVIIMIARAFCLTAVAESLSPIFEPRLSLYPHGLWVVLILRCATTMPLLHACASGISCIWYQHRSSGAHVASPTSATVRETSEQRMLRLS